LSLCALVAVCAPLAQAVPVTALTFTPGQHYYYSAVDRTIGWAFAANSDVTVVSLGFFDFRQDGLNRAHDVGLWTSGGTLLASATVQTSSPLADWFRWVSITPLSLTAGQSYVLGAFVVGMDNIDCFELDAASVTTVPQITYDGLARYVYASSLTFPSVIYGYGTNGLFGPNIQIEVVPEPSTLVLAFAGLGLLGFARRLRKHA
jgi:hypothetical protein